MKSYQEKGQVVTYRSLQRPQGLSFSGRALVQMKAGAFWVEQLHTRASVHWCTLPFLHGLWFLAVTLLGFWAFPNHRSLLM